MCNLSVAVKVLVFKVLYVTAFAEVLDGVFLLLFLMCEIRGCVRSACDLNRSHTLAKDETLN